MRLRIVAALLSLAVVGCASAGPVPSAVPVQPTSQVAPRPKIIVYAVVGNINGIGLTEGQTTIGGWATADELHTSALITSDFDTRAPIGRLATKVPSLDDGSVSVLTDGEERVVYTLRPDVTWQDGTPFTAHDLAFSYDVLSTRALGYPVQDALGLMSRVEAPDDTTLEIIFKQPYYKGSVLGVRPFWPLPQHILQAPFAQYQQSGDAQAFLNLLYWSTEYIGTGPFRVASWDPGAEVVLHAYDGYFLGRPKADTIRVQVFGDKQTLFSSLLAGTVDIFPENTLDSTLVDQLQQRWGATNGGAAYIKEVTIRFLTPQWRPEFQMEPATQDARVRAALYRAIDRESLAEAKQQGHREMAAWGILPPQDPSYAAAADAMRPYAYDPDRTKAELAGLGWTLGSDGLLHNATDGRVFHTAIEGSDLMAGDIPVVADYWRRIGLQVDEIVTPSEHARDLQYLAQFRGWLQSAGAPGDGIIKTLDGPPASAQTQWSGNRSGLDDPQAVALLARYRGSLSASLQLEAMRGISDYVAANLPIMVTYRATDGVGVRTGISALQDHMGGDVAGVGYGTWTRNAHLWDVV